MQFLKHNWKLKVLCLGLALLLQGYVRKQEDKLRTSLLLPVNIQAPAGQRLVEPSSSFRVRVDLEGPAEVVRTIDNEAVRLKYDLSNVRPGKRTDVPITVERPEKYRD